MRLHMPSIALLATLYAPGTAHADPTELKWLIPQNQSPEPDEEIRQTFKALETELKARLGPRVDFDPKITPTPYLTVKPTDLTENTIAIIPALKFALVQDELELSKKKPLIPLLVVEREDSMARCSCAPACGDCKPVSTYYSTMFIRRKGATIESLTDSGIKKLSLVSRESASGYLLPLERLWTSGVIAAPTEAAARARFTGENFDLAGSRHAVCDQVVLNRMGSTIGAVWNTDPNQCKSTEKLLIHGRVLQDLVIVSENLRPLGGDIKAFFTDEKNRANLLKPPFEIHGFVDFAADNATRIQHEAALQYLTDLHARAVGGEPSPKPTSSPERTSSDPFVHTSASCERSIRIGEASALQWSLLGAAIGLLLGGIPSILVWRKTRGSPLADRKRAKTENHRKAALIMFLVRVFNTNEFRRFVQLLVDAKTAAEFLPQSASLADQVFEFVDHMSRRAKIDDSFFEALRNEMPPHAKEISELALTWKRPPG